jgi:23S rRNA (uracil1939-C5)-methyltransferase
MIPLTEEIETIAVLHRTDPALPRLVYEDIEILVVEKGAHEPTMPQGEYATSLLARARRLPGAASAVPVHRLDVGTSGLVFLARTSEHVARWERVFAAARKIYVAAVRGVTPAKGAITRDLREDGQQHPARSRYRRLAVASGQSVLRVVPEPGRTHQVRRHLAAVGHPILGDDRYGHPATNRYFEERNGLDRLFLHCVRIEFEHPTTLAQHIVEAPLPGDLRAVLERISGPDTLRFLEHKRALGSALGGTSGSSLPPAPADPTPAIEEALDVDAHSPTIHPPELTDDDQRDGGQTD